MTMNNKLKFAFRTMLVLPIACLVAFTGCSDIEATGKNHRVTANEQMIRNGVLILMASTALVFCGYASFGQSLDDSAARAALAAEITQKFGVRVSRDLSLPELYLIVNGLNEILAITRHDHASLDPARGDSPELGEIEARIAMANRINQEFGTSLDWRQYDFLELSLVNEKLRGRSAGEPKPVRTIVADQQGAEVFPASFGQCVSADNELLRLRDLEFDPGTAAPTVFVDRIFSFGNQPFEAKLLRDPEELISGAAEFVREPDIFRGILEHLSEKFAPGAQRFLTQIFSFQEQQIEDVIDQWYASRLFE
jgi:hypothetical protein